MKKNDLIKKLQELKGNPEVLLWNGYVGDWMKIGSIVESDLTKLTIEHYVESVRLEEAIDKKDWSHSHTEEELKELNTLYKKIEWESNPFVLQKDIDMKRNKTKKVIFIDAKSRGIDNYDRIGGISY